jgi:hypothetical protein
MRPVLFAAAAMLFAAPAIAAPPTDGAAAARVLDGSWSLAPGDVIGPFPSVAFTCENPVGLRAIEPDKEWVDLRIPDRASQRLDIAMLSDVIAVMAEPWALVWISDTTIALAPKDVSGQPRRGVSRKLTRCK